MRLVADFPAVYWRKASVADPGNAESLAPEEGQEIFFSRVWKTQKRSFEKLAASSRQVDVLLCSWFPVW